MLYLNTSFLNTKPYTVPSFSLNLSSVLIASAFKITESVSLSLFPTKTTFKFSRQIPQSPIAATNALPKLTFFLVCPNVRITVLTTCRIVMIPFPLMAPTVPVTTDILNTDIVPIPRTSAFALKIKFYINTQIVKVSPPKTWNVSRTNVEPLRQQCRNNASAALRNIILLVVINDTFGILIPHPSQPSFTPSAFKTLIVAAFIQPNVMFTIPNTMPFVMLTIEFLTTFLLITPPSTVIIMAYTNVPLLGLNTLSKSLTTRFLLKTWTIVQPLTTILNISSIQYKCLILNIMSTTLLSVIIIIIRHVTVLGLKSTGRKPIMTLILWTTFLFNNTPTTFRFP